MPSSAVAVIVMLFLPGSNWMMPSPVIAVFSSFGVALMVISEISYGTVVLYIPFSSDSTYPLIDIDTSVLLLFEDSSLVDKIGSDGWEVWFLVGW